MGLSKYKQKRNFSETPEPEGKESKGKGALKFVIQRHAATRLHYDFRLEMEGVLKSWAVPKGPSLNPSDKRLAMMVEDHPFSYRTFEGVIPEGNYGAGVVEIWDEGTYEHIEDKNRKTGEKKLLADLHKGSIKIVMHGDKLKGEFALVKIKGGEGNAWLLIKHKDEHATSKAFDAEKLTDKNSKVTEAVKAKAAKKTRNKTVIADKKPSKDAIKQVSKSATPLKKKYIAEPAEKKLSDFIVPMMAKLSDKAFSGENWLFEIKWDGYRAIAEAGKKNVKLYSRNGLSFADKYWSVYEELQNIRDEMILDGEIVVLNEQGRPDFQSLQNYDQNQHLPIVYYVFDILKYKGKSVNSLPLVERKELLKKILPESEIIRYCEHVEEEGELFFQKMQELNVEGMIAKRKDSTYVIGKRTGDWLKIKHHNIEEVVIAGYTDPRGGRKFFGALVLGRYEGNELKYAGHTGTGFDDKSLKDLYNKLQPLVIDKSPFKGKIKTNMPVTWVKPELVCNIKFTELTSEKIFRHPVFMGLRIDKKAIEVKADDMPAKKSVANKTKKAATKKATKKSKATTNKQDETETGTKIIKINGNELKFTNRNKLYWPEEGFTKGDVIDYYNQVYKYILPYLKDRPESLRRNPNGINGQSFFQKDAGGQAPDWVESIVLYSESAKKDIDYILCNDRATLLYLANLGCIEINPWNSRVGKLEYPDYIVMDLDPSDNNTFEDVIDAALATKEVLDKAGAVGYCKTSGASGLHIYIPMAAKYTYDQARDFCKLIAMHVQDMLPDTTTLERSLRKRSDSKIYLDALQNKQGQTLSSVYSLRPKPGATVSAPLEWKEVKYGLHPSQFHINNILERIEKKGDLFKGVLGKGVDMMKCLKKLDE